MEYKDRVKLDVESVCKETPEEIRHCPLCGKGRLLYISTPNHPLEEEDLICGICKEKFPERKKDE